MKTVCLPDCKLCFGLEYYGTFKWSDTLWLDFFGAFHFQPQNIFLEKYTWREDTRQIKIGLLTDLSCKCQYEGIRRQMHF